jgi:hypothetical protein
MGRPRFRVRRCLAKRPVADDAVGDDGLSWCSERCILGLSEPLSHSAMYDLSSPTGCAATGPFPHEGGAAGAAARRGGALAERSTVLRKGVRPLLQATVHGGCSPVPGAEALRLSPAGAAGRSLLRRLGDASHTDALPICVICGRLDHCSQEGCCERRPVGDQPLAKRGRGASADRLWLHPLRLGGFARDPAALSWYQADGILAQRI